MRCIRVVFSTSLILAIVNIVDPSPVINWYFNFLWIYLLATNILYALAILIVPMLVNDNEPNEERVSNSYFLVTIVGLGTLAYFFIRDIIRLLN